MDAEAILHNKLWYNLGSNWTTNRYVFDDRWIIMKMHKMYSLLKVTHPEKIHDISTRSKSSFPKRSIGSHQHF